MLTGCVPAGKWAQVAFVEPRSALFAENPRHTLPIQVHPLVVRTVQAIWQVLKTLRVDFVNFLIDECIAVSELQRRQGPGLECFLMPSLRDGEQLREDRIGGSCGVLIV